MSFVYDRSRMSGAKLTLRYSNERPFRNRNYLQEVAKNMEKSFALPSVRRYNMLSVLVPPYARSPAWSYEHTGL